jgi:hypothetical protein
MTGWLRDGTAAADDQCVKTDWTVAAVAVSLKAVA